MKSQLWATAGILIGIMLVSILMYFQNSRSPYQVDFEKDHNSMVFLGSVTKAFVLAPSHSATLLPWVLSEKNCMFLLLKLFCVYTHKVLHEILEN